MTETYFGEIVHNPKYWDWVEKNMPKDGYFNKDILRTAPDPCDYTDSYQVWVVDTPDKLWTGSIFNASMAYARNKKMSAREGIIGKNQACLGKNKYWNTFIPLFLFLKSLL